MMNTPLENYKGRSVDPSREVWVYKNLRRGDGHWWSLMQDGLVVGHSRDLILKDARFVVREAGRRRAVRDRRKNVHAFVVGTLTDKFLKLKDFESVTYNPFNSRFFRSKVDGRPVFEAAIVSLGGQCFVQGAK